MEYHFKCDIKATDLWKISMKQTYRSFLGVINVIFAISMIAMTIKLWNGADVPARILMILCCLIFPVFQPLAILGKSCKQLEQQPGDVELFFHNNGIQVVCGEKKEMISWNRVTRVIYRSDMIVVKTGESHGYMIMNRTMGEQKEAFYRDLLERLNKQKK